MPTYRVKEKFVVTGWTIIEAESKKDAIDKLENGKCGDGEDMRHQDWDHQDTDMTTFQEI